VHLFSSSMFLLFFYLIFQHKKINKNNDNWGRRCRILYFFLLIAFQILHVFWPYISVHCALMEYAYI
jgi:hypothetical protein